MASQPTPVEIRRQLDPKTSHGNALLITWSSGETSLIDSQALRLACPCATCQETRGDTSHAKPLGGKSSFLRVVKATADESSDLQEIWAIGNYAIGIRWGDAHDTGIYPYVLLQKLAEEAPATKGMESKEA